MPFQTSGAISYYQFDLFGDEIVQAVFTRKGGSSPAPWSSLNVGSTVGDAAERVRENRRQALESLGRTPDSVFDAWQVHGTEVVVAQAPRPPESPHPQADIILTDTPGVTLMMRFADCVPILLHDPVRKVVGLAHAGWMGTVQRTAKAAVESMHDRFGTDPADIRAAIGPSIGPDHYQIGTDVGSQVSRAFGSASTKLLNYRDGSLFFDLWNANLQILLEAGVHQIENAAICTYCHNDDWFSHRAEKGRTGRFGAVIALKD